MTVRKSKCDPVKMKKRGRQQTVEVENLNMDHNKRDDQEHLFTLT